MGAEVRLATISDAAAIGSVFARAFANDPVSSWVTPDAGRRAKVLARLNTAIARNEGIPRGATSVAEEAGTIVGAAIWQPPGRHPLTWRTVCFAVRAGTVLGSDIPRMIRAGLAARRHRPVDRHWYLQLLGVDPAAQGRGVGQALVRKHLEVVDSQRGAAYLETTAHNLEFYRRLGFEPIGEIAIADDAPIEYPLYRTAR